MSNGIYGIGISGLSAAQAGLVTTGHNIANANNPGFHRQAILQTTNTPLLTGSGYFGQGTKVSDVERVYSQFLDAQVAQSQSQASFYTSYHTELSQLDNIVGSASAGLSPALQEFFTASNAVASNPASVPARQSLLSAAATLTTRFNSLGTRFEEIRSDINAQVTGSVSEINSFARQIATLNHSVVVAQGEGHPPNDLLDQRDSLIGQLNKIVGTSITTQSDGSVNVYIGTGQSLVIGNQVMTLVAIPAADDALRLEVGYNLGSTTSSINPASLNGGSLGGLLAFRANDLDASQNALGRVAVALSQTFNAQHRLGQDLSGALGTAFFNSPAAQVIGKSNNSGNAVITAAVTDVNALTTSDYRLTAHIVAGVTSYSVLRTSDNTNTNYASLPQTIDGVSIGLASGAMGDGDSVMIRPTRSAATDIRAMLTDPALVAAAAPIRSGAAAANTGSATITPGTVNSPPPPNVNLQAGVAITFTGANTYKVVGTGTGDPVGLAYTSGGDITYNGWTVQISGTPGVGDVFTLSANSGGVSDGRNALLLSGLQTKSTMANSTTNFQGAYSQLVGTIGNKTREIEVSADAQTELANQATQAQQSVSGVNLDEEAANLLRYQQAYQAAGKMIQIATTMFETLLSLGR